MGIRVSRKNYMTDADAIVFAVQSGKEGLYSYYVSFFEDYVNEVMKVFTMYMGIQSFWLTFAIDNADVMFEKNFDITWQAIEYQ